MNNNIFKYSKFLLFIALIVVNIYPAHSISQSNSRPDIIKEDKVNQEPIKMGEAQFLYQAQDSSKITLQTDSTKILDSKKALWYSILCPGLGQIYNKRYWKVPIILGGITGLIYGTSWNQKYYKAYTKAYRDISDNDESTNSYLDLLPVSSTTYDTDQLTTILKNRQQTYRRYRDLCIIGCVGTYLICILDSYVDAELSDFDVSDDLSIHIEPIHRNIKEINSNHYGLSLSINF